MREPSPLDLAVLRLRWVAQRMGLNTYPSPGVGGRCTVVVSQQATTLGEVVVGIRGSGKSYALTLPVCNGAVDVATPEAALHLLLADVEERMAADPYKPRHVSQAIEHPIAEPEPDNSTRVLRVPQEGDTGVALRVTDGACFDAGLVGVYLLSELIEGGAPISDETIEKLRTIGIGFTSAIVDENGTRFERVGNLEYLDHCAAIDALEKKQRGHR